MPETTITVTEQTVEINDVTDIAVIAIVHDLVRGDYYREVRVFGTPPTGVTTTNPVSFILRVRSDDPETLKFTVPESEF